MLTYTKLLERYTELTDDSQENINVGGGYINDSIRTICNIQGGKLRFLEDVVELETVANQEGYQIPNKFRKIIDLYISNVAGTPTENTIYMPEMIFDPTRWKTILAYRLGFSDVPYFTYVQAQKFLIQPIPSTSGNIITVRGRLNTRDLSHQDYTTGTIVSVANEGTTVTGSGTSWTSGMEGRYINIPNTTASNGGDGFWYEIASVTSATELELLKPYSGESIVAGSASYTIGEVPVVPEAYQMAIVYRSAALYWENHEEPNKARMYWTKYDGGNELGINPNYGGIISQMLSNEGETEEGSYIPPVGKRSNLPDAPYYLPYQDASGFN